MASNIYYAEGAYEPSQILANYMKEPLEKCVFKLPEEQPQPLVLSLSLEEGLWDIKHQPLLSKLHSTTPIKQSLGQVSAIPQFFSLLKTSLSPIALIYICECIILNTANYKLFLDNGG